MDPPLTRADHYGPFSQIYPIGTKDQTQTDVSKTYLELSNLYLMKL